MPKQQLFSLTSVLCDCQNLMGIHLNDLGLYNDHTLFMDLLNIFGLGDFDPASMHRPKLDMNEEYMQDLEEEKKQKQVITNDVLKVIDKTIRKNVTT